MKPAQMRYPDDYTARCWRCKQLCVDRKVAAGLLCQACHTEVVKGIYAPAEGTE